MGIAAALMASLALAPLQGAGVLDVYLRGLAEAGNVQTEPIDRETSGLDADTRFDLTLDAQWNYELSAIRRGTALELQLRPEWTRLETNVKHRIRLPSKGPSSEQYRALLSHEYDHVAISTDERPALLLRKLVQGIGTLTKSWEGPVPPPEASMNALIAAEVEARKKAVVGLVEFAYGRLDRLTDHGRRPLANRTVFSGWLYSADHLAEAKFPYLKEATPILGSAEMRLARRWFRA